MYTINTRIRVHVEVQLPRKIGRFTIKNKIHYYHIYIYILIKICLNILQLETQTHYNIYNIQMSSTFPTKSVLKYAYT